MAKKASSSSKKNDYTDWLKVYNLTDDATSKEMFEDIKKVMDHFAHAKASRANNCYWLAGAATSDGIKSTGGDWTIRWTRHDKLFMMWFIPPSEDDFRSNVKSPATLGRVIALINKIKQLDIKWAVHPTNDKDIGKAKIAQLMMNWVFQQHEFKKSLEVWIEDSFIHGSSFARLYIAKIVRNYSYPQDDPKALSKDDKSLVQDKKIIWSKPKKVIKSKGIVLEPVPIYEVYPDGQAKFVHSPMYGCRYIIRRKIMQMEDFKAQYENNPDAENVDKVQPATAYKQFEDYRFFVPPQDLYGKMVEVIEYENEVEDEMITLANDMRILKTPLIYKHKELTWHKLDAIIKPHEFYHMGIPDLLENMQGAEEIMMNMAIDYVYRTVNKSYLVDTSIYGEATQEAIRANSQYIPVTTNGQPLNNLIMQMQQQPIGFDLYKMLDMTSKNQTQATLMDPQQMMAPMQNRTATATVNQQQIADVMLNGIVDNLTYGLTQMGKQLWKLIQQHYSVEEVKEIVGDNGETETKAMFTKIRLKGLEIKDDDPNDIQIEESNKDFTFFEVKDDYLFTDSELEIEIAPESLQYMTKSMEMQTTKELYSMLMPNAVDPSDEEMIAMMKQTGREPLWDATKLAQWFAEKNDVPQDMLITDDTDDEEELASAQQDVKDIMNGEIVPGIPGRSEIHKLWESRVLDVLTSNINTLQENIADEQDQAAKQAQGQPQFDPMSGQPLPPLPPPPPNPAREQELKKLTKFQQALAQHLEEDNEAKYAAFGNALKAAQPPAPPPMPPQGAPPMGGQPGQSPMMMPPGGMGVPMPGGQQNPMAGPGGQPGQVPMPSGPNMQNAMPNFGGQQ